MIIDYSQWCLRKPNKLGGFGHDEWLHEYTKWRFGPFPYHRTGEPLYVHGNNNARTGCNKRINLIDGPDNSATIYENDPIIVEVIGANFVIGDFDQLGNKIKTDADILSAIEFEDQMHSLGNVEFKEINEDFFTNLSAYIEHIRTAPFDFFASPHNPYLNEWDIPMPIGDHRGIVSSQLLLLSIPKEGEYLLKFEASSFSDFESCGIYQILVKSRSGTKSTVNDQRKNLKDRYQELEDKVISVTTGKVLKLSNKSIDSMQENPN